MEVKNFVYHYPTIHLMLPHLLLTIGHYHQPWQSRLQVHFVEGELTLHYEDS